MKVATAREMGRIDAGAMNIYGIPGAVLMENAGAAVARRMDRVWGPLVKRRICVFAGKGNNGGDGFVIARHLHNLGALVTVFLMGERGQVAGDARLHLGVLGRMGIDVYEAGTERDWDKVRVATAFADLLVDAMAGTGFRGAAAGPLAQAVEIINRAEKPVIAVDIPSGVDADTGEVAGAAVRAAETVTFGLPKPGLLLQPGASLAGTVTVDGIGIPSQLLSSPDIRQNRVDAALVRPLLPVRRPDAHKGDCGRVGLVAGSPGMTGAAALTASGALRTGAGLVTVGVAAGLQPAMALKLTEAMSLALPEEAPGVLGLEAAEEIVSFSIRSSVLAVGPGLGTAPGTQAMVREVVRAAACPLVIDADALNALAGYADLLPEAAALAVLTPHPGELARLTGVPAQDINRDRIKAAREAAARWGCVLVLKGAGTVVAFPDGEVFINTTGNAGMATGGSGDVLTGVIAALIAQGLSSHDAAVAGVFLHGLAGDLAAEQGMTGMTAGDIVRALPAAIRKTRGV